LIVSPNADVAVIAEARQLGLVCLPGVATPTEAFAALRAGATGLKLFPAEMLPPTVVKAWRAVIPEAVALLPVGGISAANIAAYRAAGASGFGIGGSLYRSGVSADQVSAVALALRSAWLAAD
jgi:2-dehydro-3-deoxyphosphogalactonate aldolase